VIAQQQPALVHAHSWIVHSFTPLKLRYGMPLVVTLHEMGLRCAKKNLVHAGGSCSGPALIKCSGCCTGQYGSLTGPAAALALFTASRLELALTDMFLPVSQAVARGSCLIGSRYPFEIIPNFVPDDLSSDDSPSSVTSCLPSSPYLLYVGALGQHKGLQVLLDAYTELSLDIPLVLIGPRWGDTPHHLPPSVILHDSWPHQDVLQAMHGSLMTLVPSIVPEASPTVVLEAMAAGCPVVASHLGGIPDMIRHGGNGILVPPGDAPALSAAVRTLLADPVMRQRMGEVGRERVKAFQAKSIIPRIEEVYERVVTAHARSRVA
jgi:glycosyltransferase involved in cell wall biosynthesis